MDKLLLLAVIAFQKMQEALKDKKVTVGEALDLWIAEIMAAEIDGNKAVSINPKTAAAIRKTLTMMKKAMKGGEYSVLELSNIVKDALGKYGLLDHALFEVK